MVVDVVVVNVDRIGDSSASSTLVHVNSRTSRTTRVSLSREITHSEQARTRPSTNQSHLDRRRPTHIRRSRAPPRHNNRRNVYSRRGGRHRISVRYCVSDSRRTTELLTLERWRWCLKSARPFPVAVTNVAAGAKPGNSVWAQGSGGFFHLSSQSRGQQRYVVGSVGELTIAQFLQEPQGAQAFGGSANFSFGWAQDPSRLRH